MNIGKDRWTDHDKALANEYLSPQEHHILGSTESPDDPGYYTPEGIFSGLRTIEETIQARNVVQVTFGGLPQMILGDLTGDFKGIGKIVAISLSRLTRETGETLEDPNIVGIYDPKTGEVDTRRSLELTRAFYSGLGDSVITGLRNKSILQGG